MNKLYIVRHGTTDWNLDGRIQGLADIDLNKAGESQVQDLKNKIDIDKIDVCFSSPLTRARRTAEILTDNKLVVIIEPLIIERCFGNLEGQKLDMVLGQQFWNYKIKSNEYGVENLKDVLKRAKKFINKIKKKYQNKNILIVTHGAFIKALHYVIKGYDENTDFLSFYPENGKVYIYNLEGEKDE